MKHPVHTSNRAYTAEWLQALFTLLVLVSLYYLSLGFDQKDNSLGYNGITASNSYWNNDLGYGFHGDDQDIYVPSEEASPDTVMVYGSWSKWVEKAAVKVSFYTFDTPKESIEKIYSGSTPRILATLSHGTAVVEWNLSSSRVKNIVATLYPR